MNILAQAFRVIDDADREYRGRQEGDMQLICYRLQLLQMSALEHRGMMAQFIDGENARIIRAFIKENQQNEG